MEILIDCLFGKAIEDWFPQTSEIIATIVFGISMYIFITEKYTQPKYYKSGFENIVLGISTVVSYVHLLFAQIDYELFGKNLMRWIFAKYGNYTCTDLCNYFSQPIGMLTSIAIDICVWYIVWRFLESFVLNDRKTNVAKKQFA